VLDDNGNKLSETFPGREAWTYTYDDNGNKLSEISFDGRVWTYAYDDNGNKLSETFPDGEVCAWTYKWLSDTTFQVTLNDNIILTAIFSK
jgi:YD repeat-containing protein